MEEAPAVGAYTSAFTWVVILLMNDLRTQGAISDAEFEQLKQRTIAAS
jgi:hypothetical protein